MNTQDVQRSQAALMWRELEPFRPKMARIGMALYAHPYGVHVSAIIYGLAATITLLGGYAIAVEIKAPMLFARFGSIVVSYGIVFAILGIDGTIKRDLRFFQQIYEAMREDEIKALQNKQNSTVEDTAKIMLTAVDKATAELKFDRLSEKIIRRTLYVNAAVLLAGTLTWGFGDLLLP